MCVFINLEAYGPHLLKRSLHSACVEICQISPSLQCILRINPRLLVLVQTPFPDEQPHQLTCHFKSVFSTLGQKVKISRTMDVSSNYVQHTMRKQVVGWTLSCYKEPCTPELKYSEMISNLMRLRKFQGGSRKLPTKGYYSSALLFH